MLWPIIGTGPSVRMIMTGVIACSGRNCAVAFTCAWWYATYCHESNLNGDYHGSAYNSVHWKMLQGNGSNIKYTEMKIISP